MCTDCLFREDAYLKECSATVVGLTDAGGVMLDRTVFYAASGGQPADRGVLTTATGDTIPIANASYTDPAKSEIAHLPAATGGLNLKIGETVHAAIDWDLRYARMRMHTALHLLSAVLPYPVTGGAVGDTDGRLDFDIPEAGLDKDEITRKLAAMIRGRRRGALALDHGCGTRSRVRPGQNHVGQAAHGHRPRQADRDRRVRPAALRRHPRASDERDRRRARDADRKEGQAEPTRADCVCLAVC